MNHMKSIYILYSIDMRQTRFPQMVNNITKKFMGIFLTTVLEMFCNYCKGGKNRDRLIIHAKRKKRKQQIKQKIFFINYILTADICLVALELHQSFQLPFSYVFVTHTSCKNL